MGGVAQNPAAVVRLGTSADLPAVGDLLAEGFADKFGRIFGPDAQQVPAVVAGFTGVRLQRGLVTLLVAEQGGQVLGVLILVHGRERLSDRWEQLKVALREVGALATLRAIVGVVLLLDTHDDAGDMAYISELAVAGSCRDQGIGTALLTRAQEWACENGKRGLSLHVAAGNPAQHLYERVGFRLERRIEAQLERWLFDVPAWLYMVKPLQDQVPTAREV